MKIILFSDSKAVFEITKKIAEGWFELIWCEYDVSQKEKYPSADIVIIPVSYTHLTLPTN